MGTWNIEKPYGNDIAADWLGDLMNAGRVRTQWLTGIQHDPTTDSEMVRAAIWLFEQLGHVYVWPIDHYAADLELAIKAADALRRAAQGRILQHAAFQQREALIARRKPAEKTA